MTDSYAVFVADQVMGQVKLAREFATEARFGDAKDCLRRARALVNRRRHGAKHAAVFEALRTSIRLCAVRVEKLDPSSTHNAGAVL